MLKDLNKSHNGLQIRAILLFNSTIKGGELHQKESCIMKFGHDAPNKWRRERQRQMGMGTGT